MKKIEEEEESMGIKTDKKKKYKYNKSSTKSKSNEIQSNDKQTSSNANINDISSKSIDSLKPLSNNDIKAFEALEVSTNSPITTSESTSTLKHHSESIESKVNTPPTENNNPMNGQSPIFTKTPSSISENDLENTMANFNQQANIPVGKTLPPEILFFGDPRNPPPAEAARDSKYHWKLLLWARHATVAPRTSQERLETVFPKGIYTYIYKPLHCIISFFSCIYRKITSRSK